MGTYHYSVRTFKKKIFKKEQKNTGGIWKWRKFAQQKEEDLYVFSFQETKACFAVFKKYQWNDIHFETYQYFFYFSGSSIV